MINIETLRSCDVGRSVIYTDGRGDKESGLITSWNDKFIFVDYGKNCGRGTATHMSDLEFVDFISRHDMIDLDD